MTEWSTVAELGTAAGTLVLAIATFGATRTANRAARTAERAFEARLRPVLVQSRREDPVEKIMWSDRHWSRVPGGQAWVEATSDAVYLAMSLRNVGAGMGVIHGWHADPALELSLADDHAPIDTFRPQSRDLYIPPNDSSFWQGAFREHDPHERATFGELIGRNDPFTVDLLYGDHEGGQRTISRFSVVHFGDDGDPSNWLVSVVRHWNIDRLDPR